MSTSARPGALLCALALAALAAGCINHPPRPAAAPPSAPASASPSSAAPSAPPASSPAAAATDGPAVAYSPRTDELATVCAPNSPGTIGTPRYGGRGPHPVAVFRGALHQEWLVDGLPPGWHAEDNTAVQLIACVEDGTDGEQVDTCTYGAGIIADGTGTTVPLRSRTYTVRLLEAYTGTVLSTTGPVVGADKHCDATVDTRSGRVPEQHTQLSVAQLTDMLRKYVA